MDGRGFVDLKDLVAQAEEEEGVRGAQMGDEVRVFELVHEYADEAVLDAAVGLRKDRVVVLVEPDQGAHGVDDVEEQEQALAVGGTRAHAAHGLEAAVLGNLDQDAERSVRGGRHRAQ